MFLYFILSEIKNKKNNIESWRQVLWMDKTFQIFKSLPRKMFLVSIKAESELVEKYNLAI